MCWKCRYVFVPTQIDRLDTTKNVGVCNPSINYLIDDTMVGDVIDQVNSQFKGKDEKWVGLLSC